MPSDVISGVRLTAYVYSKEVLTAGRPTEKAFNSFYDKNSFSSHVPFASFLSLSLLPSGAHTYIS